MAFLTEERKTVVIWLATMAAAASLAIGLPRIAPQLMSERAATSQLEEGASGETHERAKELAHAFTETPEEEAPRPQRSRR